MFLPLSCVRVVLAGLVCLACSNICPVTCPFPVLILLFLFFLYTQLMCCCVHIRRCVFAVFLPVFVLVSCCPFAPPASFAYFILGLKGPRLFPVCPPVNTAPISISCFAVLFCLLCILRAQHPQSLPTTTACALQHIHIYVHVHVRIHMHVRPPICTHTRTPTFLRYSHPPTCAPSSVYRHVCMGMHVHGHACVIMRIDM